MHKQRIAILGCAVLGVITPFLSWNGNFSLMDSILSAGYGLFILSLFLFMGFLCVHKDRMLQVTIGHKIGLIVVSVIIIIMTFMANMSLSTFYLMSTVANVTLSGEIMNELPTKTLSKGYGFFLSLIAAIGSVLSILLIKDTEK